MARQSDFRGEVETLANALGLNLQLEDCHTAGAARGGESESEQSQEGVDDLDLEGGSLGEEQQQPDALNSFARQLEEQLSSCHGEKPLGLEAGGNVQPSDPEEDDNEMAPVQAEKPFESKELLGRNSCQECTAVLPSGSL